METKSAGKALEEPTGAPRERSRITLQRKEAAEGRGNKNKHDRYRRPGAAAATPRDTRSARKADRKFTEGQQNRSQTHQEPMKGEVGTEQPTAEEARRRDGEPPGQGEQLAEPPEQHLTPKVGAQGARGRQGDMYSTGSARPRAETGHGHYRARRPLDRPPAALRRSTGRST